MRIYYFDNPFIAATVTRENKSHKHYHYYYYQGGEHDAAAQHGYYNDTRQTSQLREHPSWKRIAYNISWSLYTLSRARNTVASLHV